MNIFNVADRFRCSIHVHVAIYMYCI